jgi:hypothetical protein
MKKERRQFENLRQNESKKERMRKQRKEEMRRIIRKLRQIGRLKEK